MINSDNYFSEENRKKYMSVSTFKDFAGTFHKVGCEAAAMAKRRNELPELFKTSDAMLQGSYVDAHFEGTLDKFKAETPSLFLKDGITLGAKYKHLENVIKTGENDPYFMKFMAGEKQVVMTANIFGIEWKIKIDSYLPGVMICDLKCMASISSKYWSEKGGGYVNFIDFFGYDIQGAIYQKVVEMNTGKQLPFYIAALTKEKIPNKEIIQIDQSSLDAALRFVEADIDVIKFIIAGDGEPTRCETCDYCLSTKKLTGPIFNYDLKF